MAQTENGPEQLCCWLAGPLGRRARPVRAGATPPAASRSSSGDSRLAPGPLRRQTCGCTTGLWWSRRKRQASTAAGTRACYTHRAVLRQYLEPLIKGSNAVPAGSLRGLVRQLSIDQFENEGRRVSMHTDSLGKPIRTPLFERHSSDPGVHKVRCPRLPAKAHCVGIHAWHRKGKGLGLPWCSREARLVVHRDGVRWP